MGTTHFRLISISVAALALAYPLSTEAQPRKRRDSRLDSQLQRIVASSQRDGGRASIPRDIPQQGTSLAVTIRTTGDVSAIVASVQRLGGRIANRGKDVIEAYVVLSALATIGRLEGVTSVEAIRGARERVTSQAVSAHNASLWHANSHLGQGVKVGIIDRFAGYPALIGTELPTPAGLRCYSAVGSFSANIAACDAVSNHGTAVAESLMDVAPGVSLYLANPISKLDFRSTIEWMVSQGVTIINYSAARPWDGPGDGSSPFFDSPLNSVDLAASAGALFVTVAGNEEGDTWIGGYTDGNSNGSLEFYPGAEFNRVFLVAGEPFDLQMRWPDSWTNAAIDLDLYVYSDFGNLVDWSESIQDGLPGATPYEAVSFVAPYTGYYYIEAYHYSGVRPPWFQLQVFSSQALYYWQVGYSIGNPAESGNPGLLAVGAVHWGTPFNIAPYSSQGPTLDGRTKPDLVGVANADTVTYGPGGFSGTSQASSHVAGLAALVKQANPDYSPAQLAAYLKSAALPRGASPNNTWGFGLAYLSASPCQPVLSASGRYFFAAGGASSVFLRVSPACSWTAVSNAPWLTLTSATAGNGPTTITYAVASNTANSRRTGTLTLNGESFTVRQAGVPLVASPDDMNGDGRADVLLQHDNGALAIWFMDDTFLVDGAMLNPSQVDPAWKVVGTGDGNGDGKADIYFQHDEGYLAVWLMDGRNLVDGAQLSPGRLPAGWRVRAVADLNGDNKPDLILQHVDGTMAAWFMNGFQIAEGAYLTPNRVPPEWVIVGTGDVNRDGKLDLFFQNQQDGTLAVWLMSSTVLLDGALISPSRVDDQGWRVRGVADLNGDGRPDLLWQHTTTGNLAGWLLTGSNLLDGAIFNPASLGDPAWHIVGPR